MNTTTARHLLSALIAVLVATPVAAQNVLPLKRVLLSTGGVGYFEHEAVVDGDVDLPLSVRLAQVDDVLKSIVVYDDRGGVGTINLPGRAPLQQVFQSLPFDAQALESPVTLLRALTGAEIRVTGSSALAGRILGVTAEEVALPGGGRTTRHRVSVVVPGEGVRQFVLEDAERIELAEPRLQAEVAEALAAIARHRVQDRRTLSVSLRGAGRRVVRVGYVVEAPLWKTSYRLTVPAESAGEPSPSAKGLLQGWAVVENMSGQDWQGVEVTLASGNPVTFRQALYTAYYAARPEVPIEVMGRVLPRTDTGVLRGLGTGPGGTSSPGVAGAMGTTVPGLPGPREFAAAPPAAAPPADATVSEEATTQVLFRVPGPVTLAAGHSLVIPIVNREIPIRRVALYDVSTTAGHPLASVRLENDGESGLPPGVLTVYERAASGSHAYDGDARLGPLPRGESRLVSFAVDEKVQVAREARSREVLTRGTISRGVLRLTTVDQQVTVYRLRAPAQEGRVLLIDHPRFADWQLATPAEKDVELTRDRYRIRVPLRPGEERTVEVVIQHPRTESVSLKDSSTASLVVYTRTGSLDEKIRQTLERLVTLRGDVDREERALAALEAARQTIHQEQERLRENLKSVPGAGDLRQRYLDKLKKQEDDLETLETDIGAARTRVGAARDRLADAVEAAEP
jgi:Domain of unknown function (DUF4139)